jgi:hypothetical protein
MVTRPFAAFFIHAICFLFHFFIGGSLFAGGCVESQHRADQFTKDGGQFHMRRCQMADGSMFAGRGADIDNAVAVILEGPAFGKEMTGGLRPYGYRFI